MGLSLLALALAGCPGPLERHFITDDQGRALVLHGVNLNANAKDDPLGVGSRTREEVLRLSRDWGFNLVRYLVFWSVIEPRPGAYDEAYLDRVAERLDWCREAGLHVVLDMHQDVYSYQFPGFGFEGGVNGAPAWAIEDDGLPATWQDPWALTYLQPGVIAAFDNFWTDLEGPYGRLQEHFVGAFVRLAERFRDHPAVLGYDLYNEPFMGSSPITAFEDAWLRPFYERVIAAIRAVDADSWIFFEPQALGVNQALLLSGLGEVRDARPAGKRLVYFPHLYPLDVELGGGYAGDPVFVEMWERQRRQDLAVQRTPMLIGEFGLDGRLPGALDYVREVLAMADRVSSGWAYWAYEPDAWGLVDPDGNERPLVDLLVRAYPRRVAGRPLRYGYDPATRVFVLEMERAAGISGPTEIYVPARRFYADGARLSVHGTGGEAWTCTWEEGTEILRVDHEAPAGTVISVTVGPSGTGQSFPQCRPHESEGEAAATQGDEGGCGGCSQGPAGAPSLLQALVLLTPLLLPALHARRLRGRIGTRREEEHHGCTR